MILNDGDSPIGVQYPLHNVQLISGAYVRWMAECPGPLQHPRRA